MSKQYNSYTEEFKKTIVALYESGKKVAELVSEYDLEKKLIYNWIKKYGKVKTEAGLAIFEFIVSWYNNKRIHSSLGYITPNEKERLYYKKKA